MTSQQLIHLEMDKDEETGKWQCPVLCKPFSNHTKIVAIRQNPPGNEANVYSHEAVQELNIKSKNNIDLISGKKINLKKDLIILQDPFNEEHNKLRDIQNFKHMSMLREEKQASLDASSGNVRLSVTASRIMGKMKRKREEEDEKEKKKKDMQRLREERRKEVGDIEADDTKAAIPENNKMKIFTDELNGAEMTSGRTSGSLTSTAMSVSYNKDTREATKEEILRSQLDMMKKMKQKGFVRLTTSLGVIDLELHCDIAPRTCTNFIGLVEKGRYNGTIFHRSIRNFMIQGGKPSKETGLEKSLWGEPFLDEFDDRLTHKGPGIVSMANSGPGTNKQQFFITYKSAPHLDRKHSVFGSVAKGMEVLQEMENIPTNGKDKPVQAIKIIEAIVFLNPVKEAEKKENIRIQNRIREKRGEKDARHNQRLGKTSAILQKTKVNKESETKTSSSRIGRYLPQEALTNPLKQKKCNESKSSNINTASVQSRLPPPPKKTTFGNFSSW